MTRKSKKVLDISSVRTLDPKDPDVKYFGDEPLFALQPEPDLRKIAIVNAFNWYNHFYKAKYPYNQ